MLSHVEPIPTDLMAKPINFLVFGSTGTYSVDGDWRISASDVAEETANISSWKYVRYYAARNSRANTVYEGSLLADADIIDGNRLEVCLIAVQTYFLAQIVDHSLIAALYFNADSADHLSKDAFATHAAVPRDKTGRTESAHVFIAFLTVGELTGAK